MSKSYLFLLASGCSGCDGKAIYATITKVIAGSHWYDEADGLVIEDLTGIEAGVAKKVTVYAYYDNKAPRKLNDNEWALAGSGTDDSAKTVTTDTNVVITATALDADGQPIATLATNKQVTVA